MTRFALLSALALAALLPAPALAQPAAVGPGGVRIAEAKIDKGKLTWTVTEVVPVIKEIEVTVNVNGMNVVQKRAVTAYEPQSVTRTADLKGVKATDAAGKEIDADKLAERLKEATPVVFVSGTVPAKHRALFKDTTIFVEIVPLPATAVPGVVPAAPGTAPAVPGEKKG
jgi:hypothetical protein